MEATARTRRQFLKTAGFLTSAFVVSGCTSAAKQPPPKTGRDKPNILWITCEDTSPQYLGCYGDNYATTPNLDKLAGQSVRYTKAFATAPVSAPARSCLITGVYATSLGTQHLRSEVKLPDKIECFPQYLRAAGYYCSNNYKKDYNFTDVGAWDESSQTAHWRNRRPGQPFFSVFNFMATHQGQINGSDEEFFATYRSKLKPDERHDPDKISLPPYYPDTPLVRKIWARYYDLITSMDRQVGDLLNQLGADGLAESTIVFFFSDHGLGIPRFKRTLYDSGLRVPLMVRFPAGYRQLAPAEAGAATDRLVSFVDFAPTILNLLGLPVPDYMQGSAFLGPRTSAPREYIFGASGRVDEAYEMQRCVRDKRYKYIRNFMPHLPCIQPSEYCDMAEIMRELRRVAAEGKPAAAGKLTDPQKFWWQPTKPVEEFYDTQTDPHEINNLAGSAAHKSIVEQMRRVLRGWMIVLKRLEDGDGAVRYWAVVALTSLGEKAGPAVDALTGALTDRHPNVRFAAAGLLCRLGRCDNALDVLAETAITQCSSTGRLRTPRPTAAGDVTIDVPELPNDT